MRECQTLESGEHTLVASPGPGHTLRVVAFHVTALEGTTWYFEADEEKVYGSTLCDSVNFKRNPEGIIDTAAGEGIEVYVDNGLAMFIVDYEDRS